MLKASRIALVLPRRLTYKDQLQLSMKPLEENFIIPHAKSIKVFLFTLVTVPHSTFPILATWTIALVIVSYTKYIANIKDPFHVFSGTFLPFPASGNVWLSLPILMPQSPLISLLQLSQGMCSGMPLTSQICAHTVLAELLLVLILFSLLFFSWERSCHHLKTGITGRNHVEVL